MFLDWMIGTREETVLFIQLLLFFLFLGVRDCRFDETTQVGQKLAIKSIVNRREENERITVIYQIRSTIVLVFS